MKSESYFIDFMLGALAPVLWGTTYVVVNISLQDLTPIWVAALRVLPAGLLLLLIKPCWFPLSFIKMLLLSLFNISCFMLLLFIAAYHLPGAVAGTLTALFPIVLILISWFFYGEQPSLSGFLLSVVGLLGVVVLLNPFSTTSSLDLTGVLAAFTGVIVFSICSLWMRHQTITDLYGLCAWQLILGGIILIPLALYWEGHLPTIDIRGYLGLSWLILFNTALGYWAFICANKALETSQIGLLSLLNPIVAVVTGIGLAQESLSVSQSIGIFIILISILGIIKQDRIGRRLLRLQLRFNKYVRYKLKNKVK